MIQVSLKWRACQPASENCREHLLRSVAVLVALEFSNSCHLMRLQANNPLLRP